MTPGRPESAPRRPADFCRGRLAALEAAEGRRRRRKRDTTADAIGLSVKRALLERAVADDPAPDAFEGWLLGQCLTAGSSHTVGARLAVAREVFAEWQLAHRARPFGQWLAAGAPSDDREGTGPGGEPDRRGGGQTTSNATMQWRKTP